MKICIIYPPYGHVENQPNIKEVSKNYGVYPNLSLAYVAGICEKAGHKVRFIDANAFHMKKEDVLKEVRKFSPDILVFTITTYLIHQNISWIDYLKKNTGIPVLAGGVHFSLYPKETFKYKCLDYAVMGEAEDVLPKLLEAIENSKNLRNVNSVIYRNNDKIKINGGPAVKKDLDDSPFPARHLLPNHLYHEFITQRKNFTGMITSRGCPFKCVYCEQGKIAFRQRSPKDVLDEFIECYYDHGIREIDIFDSSFTINKKRVIEICRLLSKEKLDLEWAVRSRIDSVDSKMLSAMRRSGCSRIYYGIESGDSRILKRIGKSGDLSNIRKVVKDTNKAGIKTFGYFMIGNPEETKKTVSRTVNFAKSLELDYAQFSKVSPLPGTELYDKMLLPNLSKDYWKEYVLGNVKGMNLPRPWCNLSENEVRNSIKRAYKEFYFRPSYVYKAIKRLRSSSELFRSIFAAKDMLFS